MLELLFILILAPLFWGFMYTVKNFISTKCIANLFFGYSLIYENLRLKTKDNIICEFSSSFVLASILIASFFIFNIDATSDFIIFISFLLLSRLFKFKYESSNILSEVVNFISLLLISLSLYLYTKASFFESILTIKNVNSFYSFFLVILLILFACNYQKSELSNLKGIDKVFLDYSEMLSFTFWGALIALILYPENWYFFLIILFIYSVIIGFLNILNEKFSLIFKVILFITSIIFLILAIVGVS